MKQIHFCKECKVYTLKNSCPKCKKLSILPKPPKFSLDDKYASYRREERKKGFQKKGWYTTAN